jgi:rSAM/selenodomain-associated transferase 2
MRAFPRERSQALTFSEMTSAGDPTLSIVIPVLHEEASINEAIGAIRALPSGESAEIIVVDGNPGGSTIDAILDKDVRRLTSPAGRGRQMNEGAAVAGGDVFLFLHADTRLPSDGLRNIVAGMKEGDYVGGAFDLAIASRGGAFRIIERIASLRSRLTRIPYGDQAIFVKRGCFLSLGGYRDVPIMEDVDLMRRIRKNGGQICFADGKVRTSARRWQKEGVVRCTLRNWAIMSLYLLGAPPARLAKWYPRRETRL